MRKLSLGLIASMVCAAGAVAFAQRAPDAQQALAAASAAMGTVRTLQFSGSGSDFVLGQHYDPASPWPRFTVKSFTRQIDYDRNAIKTDRVRAQFENPPRGGGQQPVRGDQTQTQTVIAGQGTPWAQQLELWMTPHGFLKAAASRTPTARTQRVGGQPYTVVTFNGDNGAKVNGYINAQNLVERVETWIDNPLYGDLQWEAVYSDYQDAGGVKVPRHVVQRQLGWPTLDITVSDVKPNAEVSIAAPPAPAPAAPAATPSEKLGDGVYLILGGYASIAVDFKDYIVLIESAQSEERGIAVINEAKRLIPNKPIRYVINTHHHVDHSSGLRPVVAEGATIVTHEINKPWFERVFAFPHTLNPDRLAKAPRKATFELVKEKKVMTDGNHVIEIHHMQGNGHNAGLLMVYLPKEKVLLEADAYNPAANPNAPAPTPVSPYTANLVSEIARLNLDVQRIVPVHYAADNRVVTRAELMRIANPGTN